MKRDDDALYVTGQRNSAGKVICGSRKSTYPHDPRPCQSIWVMENGRCKVHGGKIQRGMANPNFISGRYSKAIPERLAALYQEAKDDPVLLDLGEDIQLVLTRIKELVSKLDAGESGSLWRLALSTFEDFEMAQAEAQEAKRRNDTEAQQAALVKSSEALMKHRALLKRGAADYAAWGEIVTLIDQRRKLVESQRKRMIEESQFIEIERMYLQAGLLAQSLKTHVQNLIPAEYQLPLLKAVADDLRRFDQPDALIIHAGSHG